MNTFSPSQSRFAVSIFYGVTLGAQLRMYIGIYGSKEIILSFSIPLYLR